MLVRFPRIDYSRVRPHWASNREFAHDRNATSTIPTYTELCLIKITNRAKEAWRDDAVELRKAVETFNLQEGQHTLLPVLSPLYDPGKKRTPRGMDEYLARFEKGGDMGREPVAAG